MIQGFALQATQYDAAAPGGSSIYARQVIIVPAAKMIWSRMIAAHAPKKTWRKRPAWGWDLSAPWGHGSVQVAMERLWSERHTADWHLTGAPVGFQMTDDEYLELARGTMPRNVALRFQRALEATEQIIIGAKASHEPSYYCGVGLPSLDVHTGDRTSDRLTAELTRLAKLVTDDDTHRLAMITPHVARARGAGRHRNEYDLPGMAKAEPVAAAPESEPVVVVMPTEAPPVVERKTPSGAVKPGDRITAADGVVYVARQVLADEKNLSDVELFRRAYADSMNVLLLGEPGTGKTRGLLAAFPDAIVVPVTGDTEVSDLIGSYVPSGPDSFIWVDGPLVRAMEEGRMLVLDEIGMADSKVLALAYPLMDKKGEARKLLVTANPARGTITAKDGFGIAGTSNPDAKGVHIAEPLLSRCAITMTVTTDYAVARALGCNERLVQAAEHMAKQRENGEMGWAPEMRNLLDAKRIEEQFGVIMALRALIMQAPAMEREVVEIQLRERFGDLPGAAKRVKALGV